MGAVEGKAALLGAQLKARREALRISQDELALVSGVSRNTISNFERGQGDPQSRTIEDLMRALGFKTFSKIIKPKPGDPIPDIEESVERHIVQEVYRIIRQLRRQGQDRCADELAQAYLNYSGTQSAGAFFLFRETFLPYMSGTRGTIGPIRRTLDWWSEQFSGAVEASAGLASRHQYRSEVLGRVPLRVRALLENADVVDAEITPLPHGSRYTMVTMVVRDGGSVDDDDPEGRQQVIETLRAMHDVIGDGGSS